MIHRFKALAECEKPFLRSIDKETIKEILQSNNPFFLKTLLQHPSLHAFIKKVCVKVPFSLNPDFFSLLDKEKCLPHQYTKAIPSSLLLYLKSNEIMNNHDHELSCFNALVEADLEELKKLIEITPLSFSLKKNSLYLVSHHLIRFFDSARPRKEPYYYYPLIPLLLKHGCVLEPKTKENILGTITAYKSTKPKGFYYTSYKNVFDYGTRVYSIILDLQSSLNHESPDIDFSLIESEILDLFPTKNLFSYTHYDEEKSITITSRFEPNNIYASTFLSLIKRKRPSLLSTTVCYDTDNNIIMSDGYHYGYLPAHKQNFFDKGMVDLTTLENTIRSRKRN